MGRLLGHRCYLVGPIDRCENNGKDWRNKLKPFLADLGVFAIDPLDKPSLTGLEDDDSREYRKDWKTEGRYDEFSVLMREIRTIDLGYVDTSDFLIVYLDLNSYPCGTYEELFWANRLKRPILIWCPQGKNSIPDWLFGTLPHQMMFSSYEELCTYLKEINNNSKINTYGRWKFFNIKKLYSKDLLDRIAVAL